MDPNEQTVVETEADTALTPSATDGASSSDAADQAPESAADLILREFQEQYGDDEPGETDESDDEGEQESAPEPEAAEPKSEQTPEEDQVDDAEDDQFRIPDEQFKSLPEGVRKRLGHLNTRAKKAERELSNLEKDMVPLKDAHQRFTQLQTFVQDNEIQPENVTLLFNAAASLSKGDYKSFLEMVKPWYDMAQQASGEAIAPDLQSRVDDGYLSVEDAQALTRARVQGQISQSRVEALTTRQKQDRDAQQSQQVQQRIVSAITARENELKSSDPDYAQKSQAMQSMVEFALKSGARPTNEQEALALINDAYNRVNATFQKPKPPKATIPMPSASSSPRGNPAPETTREAIFQGLRDMPTA